MNLHYNQGTVIVLQIIILISVIMKLLVSLIFLRNYVNTLPDSTAKKLVDFATCAILQKLQIVPNVQHYVLMGSKNVWKFVQLANRDVCVTSFLTHSKVNIHIMLIGKWVIAISVVLKCPVFKLQAIPNLIFFTNNIEVPESLSNREYQTNFRKVHLKL